MDISLASQSPRRRELLERMGIRHFRVVISDTDENVDPSLTPQDLVCALAKEKALAVQKKEGIAPLIIAADTVVSLDGTILGKPEHEVEAFTMLSTLSGCRHQVYTGVCVLQGETCRTEVEVTDVTFRPLESEEIEHYIKTGEPMDKAGAYGIQGYGCLLVSGITGDYYNVMGLPICLLRKILAEMDVDCLKLAAGKR